MNLLIKGLVDRKKLFKNLLILSILLFVLAFLAITIKYQDCMAETNREKIENRTVTIKSKTTNFDYVNDFKSKIENTEYIDELNVVIIFKTSEDKNTFINTNNKFIDDISINVDNSHELYENSSKTFQGLMYLVLFAVLLLITIFNSNYLYSLKKTVALYRLLGIPKVKIIFITNLFLNLIYSFIYVFSYIIIYGCYYLVIRNNEMQYYNLFKIDYYVILIIVLSLIIATAVSLKNGRNRNDLDVLRL